MPVLELCPATAGRLTRLSMLTGFGVFLAGVTPLHWRVRTLFAPDARMGRGSRALTAAVPIVAGCGTVAIFLASRAWSAWVWPRRSPSRHEHQSDSVSSARGRSSRSASPSDPGPDPARAGNAASARSPRVIRSTVAGGWRRCC